MSLESMLDELLSLEQELESLKAECNDLTKDLNSLSIEEMVLVRDKVHAIMAPEKDIKEKMGRLQSAISAERDRLNPPKRPSRSPWQ